MKKPLVFSAALNLKASASGPRRFSIVAYNGGTLPVNGFDYPVVVDLTGLESPSTIPLLLNHQINTESTLGQTDSIVNDGAGITIAGPVTGVSELCRNVLAMSDAGQVWQASIGLLVFEQEDIAPGQQVTVNGQTFTGPVIVARSATLRETSVLPIGADATTSVNLAAAAALLLKGAAMPTFEEWLQSLGIDAAALTDAGRALLLTEYEEQQTAPPTPPVMPAAAAPVAATAPTAPIDETNKMAAGAKLNLVAQMRHAAGAEMERQAKIKTLCEKHPVIGAKAISDGWDEPTTKIAVLEAQLKDTHRAPAGHVKSGGPATGRVLEAALHQQRKIAGHEKAFTDQENQEAHTMFKGRIGLQQMVLQAAAANGMVVNPGTSVTLSNAHDVFAYAFNGPNSPRRLEAAFSTVSLPGIFSNVANKEIEAGYMEEDQTWREVSIVKSSKDTKVLTTYRMLDNFEYEQVGPGGEIKHGTISEESYTRQAKLYAKMFALTLESILADDLGALDDIKARLGRGSAKKMNKLFWTNFLNDAAFFTAARGNYITGSTSNLLTDGVGLQQGVVAFDALRSPVSDGSKIIGSELVGGQPEILLHPPQIAQAAEALYRNQNLGAVKTPDANTYQGKYRPVKCKYIGDSSISGYSATAWYLLRGKAGLQPMVVTFLDGQETPNISSADADFNTLGVQFRGWHGFGCDQAEYLCGIKSKGAA